MPGRARAQPHLGYHQQLRAPCDDVELAQAAAEIACEYREARLLQRLRGARFSGASGLLPIDGLLPLCVA